MNLDLNVIKEDKPRKVGGIYDNEQSARAAVSNLVSEGGFASQHIKLIQPYDDEWDQKVDPDDRGIARTLVKSHVVFGVTGMLAGLLLALVLVGFGPVLARANPLMTVVALTLICSFLGLIFAGFISLRPDQDRLIEYSRAAGMKGLWTVVVHTNTRDEKARARNLMSYSAASIAESY